jgi:clan AA aspartic protease
MKEVCSCKLREQSLWGRFAVKVELANYGDLEAARRGLLNPKKVRRLKIKGVVDPGATGLVLPLAVVNKLGLEATGQRQVRYADGRTATRETVEASLELLGRHGVYTATVEPDRRTALVGAIVLEDLDYLVDCRHQRLVPRDPRFVISYIE